MDTAPTNAIEPSPAATFDLQEYLVNLTPEQHAALWNDADELSCPPSSTILAIKQRPDQNMVLVAFIAAKVEGGANVYAYTPVLDSTRTVLAERLQKPAASAGKIVRDLLVSPSTEYQQVRVGYAKLAVRLIDFVEAVPYEA